MKTKKSAIRWRIGAAVLLMIVLAFAALVTHFLSWNFAEKIFDRNFGFSRASVHIVEGGSGTYEGWREYEYVSFSTSDSRQLYDFLSANNYGYPSDDLEALCRSIAEVEGVSLKEATIRYRGAASAPHDIFVSYVERDELLDVLFIKSIKD